MKVLFVSSRDLKAQTSFEMYNIARKISKKVECYLIFPSFDENILGSKKKYEKKNLKIIVEVNPVKIFSIVRKINPIIVHVWYSNIYQLLVALLAKIFVRSKIILHVTDFEEFFVFKNIKFPIGVIKSILKIIAVKMTPLLSDGITIISPNLKEYVIKTKAKKKHLIYVLLPYTPKSYFRVSTSYMKELKNRKNNFWFLYFGFISKFQGVEEIITSFLKANIKTANLIVIGDGPLKKDLVKKYKYARNIIFLGSLKRKELFCFCESSDCILCYFPPEPINELRLPAKLRESMFFGKPIITTNIGFCKLLSNNSILKVGFNENELKKAIREVYGNKKLRQKLSKKIKKEFEKWFQNENNIHGLLLFYQKIIET